MALEIVLAPLHMRALLTRDPIDFAATATDAQETLPPSAYKWQEIVNHCPSNCHQHFLATFTGPNGPTPPLQAPDHEYPSTLELRLTVTDSGGLTDVKSVVLNPKTVDLTLASAPAGLQLTLFQEPDRDGPEAVVA